MITVAAIAFATIIIIVLSYLGKKSKGPLEELVTSAGETVQEIERVIILDQREDQRRNKLQWLKNNESGESQLKNPRTILLGAFDNREQESFESIINLEDTLKTTFPLIHIYSAWGSRDDEEFPELQVKSILGMGSFPVITWEPWLCDFDGREIPGLRDRDKRDKGGMKDIASGLYDVYITTWAREAAKINEPIFLRLGHEMNDPYRYPWGPHNNPAGDFKAAWHHIYDLFKKEGAGKIIWVWSPHAAYGYFDAFYPGDDYVDYVGVGTLNYGTVANWSKWWTFDEIFGNHYTELAVFKKPIMLTELGCLNAGGSRDQWFADALHRLPQKYPLIKSILFFHYSEDITVTQQALNWYIIDDTATVRKIVAEMRAWENTL